MMSKYLLCLLLAIPLLLGCYWFKTVQLHHDFIGRFDLISGERIGKESTFRFSLTGGDWKPKSSVVFRNADATVEGSRIFITMHGCEASSDYVEPEHVFELSNLAPDIYTVYYRNPDGSVIKLTTLAYEI